MDEKEMFDLAQKALNDYKSWIKRMHQDCQDSHAKRISDYILRNLTDVEHNQRALFRHLTK